MLSIFLLILLILLIGVISLFVGNYRKSKKIENSLRLQINGYQQRESRACASLKRIFEITHYETSEKMKVEV